MLKCSIRLAFSGFAIACLCLTSQGYADMPSAVNENPSDIAPTVSPLNQNYAHHNDINSSQLDRSLDPEFDAANDITADNLDAN